MQYRFKTQDLNHDLDFILFFNEIKTQLDLRRNLFITMKLY